MRLALVYARTQVVELLRFPGFSIATFGFPVLFFLLFGLPRAGRRPEILVASYAAFAVLGVGFYQFGVSAAIERDTPWAAYVRTLPAQAASRIAGRLLSALVFAAGAVAALLAVALPTTSTHLTTGRWTHLLLALLFGSLPFVVLGLTIAYWTSPKSALPVANVLYMLLAYAGGLWTGPTGLPRTVAAISPYTPTRQWGDVLWPAVGGGGVGWTHWLVLAAYGTAFALFAAWGYRRDEGQRYR